MEAHRATGERWQFDSAGAGKERDLSWKTGRSSCKTGQSFVARCSAPGGDSIVRWRKSSRCPPAGQLLSFVAALPASLFLPLSFLGGERERDLRETESSASTVVLLFLPIFFLTALRSPPPPSFLFFIYLHRFLHLFVSTRFNEFRPLRDVMVLLHRFPSPYAVSIDSMGYGSESRRIRGRSFGRRTDATRRRPRP